MKRTLMMALVCAAAALAAGCQTPANPVAQIRLLEPVDGATVATKFKVRFAAIGVEVRPAGEVVAGTGHHHLLIDMDAIPAGESIPFTPKHMHFGKGQTEAEVELPPGTYRLTAQFANGAHQSYGAPLSNTIRVTVK